MRNVSEPFIIFLKYYLSKLNIGLLNHKKGVDIFLFLEIGTKKLGVIYNAKRTGTLAGRAIFQDTRCELF